MQSRNDEKQRTGLLPRYHAVERRMAIGLALTMLLSVAGLIYLVLDSLMPHTLYAPGYSEDGFAAVYRGMQEDEVFQLIGKPLKEQRSGTAHRVLYYTLPDGNSSYVDRHLILDASSVVVDMVMRFYSD